MLGVKIFRNPAWKAENFCPLTDFSGHGRLGGTGKLWNRGMREHPAHGRRSGEEGVGSNLTRPQADVVADPIDVLKAQCDGLRQLLQCWQCGDIPAGS